MTSLRILDEAAAELEAAAAYLENEREGYGALFLDAYEDKLLQLMRFPESGPIVQDVPSGTLLRAFALARFRYSIIVGIVEGTPTIIAIAHQNREPGYWRDRVG